MTANCPHLYDTLRVIEHGRAVCSACGTPWAQAIRERKFRADIRELNDLLQEGHRRRREREAAVGQ